MLVASSQIRVANRVGIAVARYVDISIAAVYMRAAEYRPGCFVALNGVVHGRLIDVDF